MLGRKERGQLELFITGSLRQLIPDDHILVRVDWVLDLSWLRREVAAATATITAALASIPKWRFGPCWPAFCLGSFTTAS